MINNFFTDDFANPSSTRIGFYFSLFIAALISLWATYHNQINMYTITLVTSWIGFSFGGKVWSKAIESKKYNKGK